MPIVRAIDRRGIEHQLAAPAGGTLMEQLRDMPHGVAAICGGMCACATCHVYVDGAWIARLPEPTAPERELLGDVATRRETSRLSCQIVLEEQLSGLTVTIAPPE
jgi:ferredoxin, 2Fe-2S